MNTELVDSLVQVIQSLSREERALLEERLQKSDARVAFQRLIELGDQINVRRRGKPFDPPLEDYIQQAREERNKKQDQLMRSSFPVSNSNSEIK